MGHLMSDEPTPADAELRERSLRELTSLTYGWTLFQVVRLSESEHQREVDDEILTAHGYHYTWGERSRTYENPDLKGTDASLAAELALSTKDWTERRPIRQFADSAAGHARRDLVTTILREHGYEPEPAVSDGQGRINVVYLRAEARARRDEEVARLDEVRAHEVARQAEERALESRYGPPSRTIGLVRIADSFDCVECGRWAEVLPTAETYARLVETTLGFNPEDWGRVRAAAQPSSPLRPAFLQREFDKGYDEAVAIIDAAVQLGVLEVAKRGVVAAQPRCIQCYERRAAIGTKPDHNQDPRPDPPADCASAFCSETASAASTAAALLATAQRFTSTTSSLSPLVAKQPRTTSSPRARPAIWASRRATWCSRRPQPASRAAIRRCRSLRASNDRVRSQMHVIPARLALADNDCSLAASALHPTEQIGLLCDELFVSEHTRVMELPELSKQCDRALVRLRAGCGACPLRRFKSRP